MMTSRKNLRALVCLAFGLVGFVGCDASRSKPADKPAPAKSDAAAKTNVITPVTAKTDTPAAAKANDKAEPKSHEKAEKAASAPIVPVGLPPLAIPEDNPMTPEKIELGKMLYFDPRLSKSGKISCATCHDPKMAWAEHSATSIGMGEQVGGRNSPTVINAAYAPAQFWDGRAKTLEEQALGPIENPIEMGHSLPTMIADLSKISAYQEQFQKVFGGEITGDRVGKAIAAFERTILSGNAPYDKFKAGDEKALTDAQKRGLEVFEVSCAICHLPPVTSAYQYINAGIGMDKEKPDTGRKQVTNKDSDTGKFRVPMLREVANTAPYFHDGSVQKLEDAVAIMAKGGKDNRHLSPLMKGVRGAEISEEQLKDLVAFLQAFSGEYPVIEPPKLP